MPVIFPVAYFGPVSYYQKMLQAEEISFEVHEHYVKQTLRNRTTILGANGIQNLSIPVIKPNGNKTLTKDILISYAENWQKNHWKAIESAYSPSPYFEHYGSEVKELVDFQTEDLIHFNQNIHQRIVQWLDLKLEEGFSHSYLTDVDPANDLRSAFKETAISANYSYTQVFSPEGKFIPDLSMLDAIFNLGPMARKLIIDK